MPYVNMTETKKSTGRFLLIIGHFVMSVVAEGPKTDYCFGLCSHTVDIHIVCKRSHRCYPKNMECDEYKADEKFRKAMLDLHNKVRNEVASGSVKGPYENKGAKNMNALSYDLELEYFASCIINDCQTTFPYPVCTNSLRFQVRASSKFVLETSFGSSFWDAAMEKMKASIDSINDDSIIKSFDSKKYHSSDLTFFNLFWAKAKYVGCSAVLFKSSDKTGVLQCTYGPVDHQKGASVYELVKESSEIASACEDGKNKNYSSLCGAIEPVPKGKMWSLVPISLSEKDSCISVYKIVMISLILIYFSVS